MTTRTSFRRSVLVLVGAAALGGLVSVGAALRQPARTQASLSFAVNRVSTVNSQEYQYDGYYAIQAADLFSQTVVSWFVTPAVLREVYAAAGLESAPDSLNGITAHFRVKKHAAQNIAVTVIEADRARAERLAKAVTQTMQTRAAALNQTADRKALFEIVGTEPALATVRPSPFLWALVGLVVGFLLGVSTLSLEAYVRSLASPDHARRD